MYIYIIQNLQTHKTKPVILKSTYTGYRVCKYTELNWCITYKNSSIRGMRPWDCSYVEMYICVIQNLQIHRTKPMNYTQNSTCGGHAALKIVCHTEIYIICTYICIIQNLQIHKTKPGHAALKIVCHTEIYVYRIQSM